MIILMLGPQGSGKGTQAQILAKKLNATYFEAGGFLREIAKSRPDIDEVVNKKGALLPDELVVDLIKDRLKNEKLDSLILDGFPRSIKQYQLFSTWLGLNGKKINISIYLDINEEESVKRLSARRTCEKCGQVYNLITNPPPSPETCRCQGKLVQRPDDTPEAIKKRIEAYNANTAPLIDLISTQGTLIRVDATPPIEEISKVIEREVSKCIN